MQLCENLIHIAATISQPLNLSNTGKVSFGENYRTAQAKACFRNQACDTSKGRGNVFLRLK